MTLAKRIFNSFQSSDGRVRLVTVSSLGVVTGLLVLVLAVLPANAGAGLPSAEGVQPDEISYGGGSGACAFIGSTLDEIHINNPMTGTFTSNDGEVAVDIVVSADDKSLSYSFVDPAYAAFDVVVNGGSKSTHYDNDGSVGPLQADQDLHAPTKGNSQANLFQLSHINICYDINPFADVSITKVPRNAAPDPGENVTFDITVLNSAASTVDATGITVTDTLPTGMTFVSASDGGSESGGVVTWPDFTLAPAQSTVLELLVSIDSDAGGDELVNSVSVTANENDPTPDNDDADSVPPVVVNASVSGTKFHDHDTDGEQDFLVSGVPEDEGLAGWTIAAFADGVLANTATTGSDGSYTITGLAPNLEYTVCEATNLVLPDGIPPAPDEVTWGWAQSDQSWPVSGACTAYAGYEPNGHVFTLETDKIGVDFGNHLQVSIDCSGNEPVEVTLGGTGPLDDPFSTVTIPGSCPSGTYVSSFDVGRSDDSDLWSQFVVFGGDPALNRIVITQTIWWDSEIGNYIQSNGTQCTAGELGCSLLVPTTQVRLSPGADLEPVVFCGLGEPNATSGPTDCLESRIIAEGNPLPAGEIQLTETYKFLGDPPRFR